MPGSFNGRDRNLGLDTAIELKTNGVRLDQDRGIGGSPAHVHLYLQRGPFFLPVYLMVVMGLVEHTPSSKIGGCERIGSIIIKWHCTKKILEYTFFTVDP